MIKTTRDVLALAILLGIIPGLWVAEGLKLVTMPGEVIGATIMAWALILQFFFRKKGGG